MTTDDGPQQAAPPKDFEAMRWGQHFRRDADGRWFKNGELVDERTRADLEGIDWNKKPERVSILPPAQEIRDAHAARRARIKRENREAQKQKSIRRKAQRVARRRQRSKR